MNNTMNAVKVGWVGYSNYYPVSRYLSLFLEAADLEWMEGVPKQVNQALRSGQIQVALSSSVNLITTPGCEEFGDFGVSCDGAVDSVYLGMNAITPRLRDHLGEARESLRLKGCGFSGVTPKKFQGPLPALHLGEVSETSALLAQIFYKLWFGRVPAGACLTEGTSAPGLRDFAPRDFHDQEFYLMIGDEAFKRQNDFEVKIDLCESWKKLTGLPFLFARWLILSKWSGEPRLCKLKELIERATHLGQQDIASARPQCFDFGAPSLAYLDTSISQHVDLLSYWRHKISYVIGARERESCELFLSLVRQLLTECS